MTYRIEFADVADTEAQEVLLWLMGRSPERADAWQHGFEKAVLSLQEFPGRCPLAPESRAFETDVRQLLYGAYRILFALIDADGDGALDTVRVLHVRHGARRPLGEDAS